MMYNPVRDQIITVWLEWSLLASGTGKELETGMWLILRWCRGQRNTENAVPAFADCVNLDVLDDLDY